MRQLKRAEWILRVGIFGTFIGHGVFALMVKKSWLPMFAAVNIPETAAVTLLPLIGMMDILIGTWILLRPNKYVLMWATFWGFWTALMRPIAGDPVWDFVERWANWAAPLALLYLRKKK